MGQTPLLGLWVVLASCKCAKRQTQNECKGLGNKKRQLQSPITPLPDPSPSPPTGSQEQAIFCRVMVGRTEVCTELQHISCCHLPDTLRTRIRECFSQSQSQSIRVRNQIFTKPIKPVHMYFGLNCSVICKPFLISALVFVSINT